MSILSCVFKKLILTVCLLEMLSVSSFAATVSLFRESSQLVVVRLKKFEKSLVPEGMRLLMTDKKSSKQALGEVRKVRANRAVIRVEHGWQNIKNRKKLKLVAATGSNIADFYAKNKVNLTSPSSVKAWLGSRKFLVDMELGTAVAPVPTLGITFGISIKPQWLVEMNTATGSASLAAQPLQNAAVGSVTTKLVTRSASIRLKKFWTNTFYSNSGIGYRQIESSGLLRAENGANATPLFDEDRRDLVIDLGVGNKWELSNFNLGVDWFGAMVSLTRASSTDNVINDSSENQNLVVPASSEKYSGETLYTRAYMGFSF